MLGIAAVAAAGLGGASLTWANDRLPRGHYVFTGVDVVAIDRKESDGKTSDHPSDKLTHWIRFDIRPKFEVVEGSERLPFKLVNATVGAKSRMTLDKPIKFKGEDLPAGENLLKYKKFNGSTFNVYMPELSPLVVNSARIQRDFEIPKDTYVVTFAWTTTRGEVLSDTVKVHIDVKLR